MILKFIIAILIQQAFDEREVADQAMGYFIKNDILMRKWRPPDVNVDDEWAVRYQIVIPKSYREEVLRGSNSKKKILCVLMLCSSSFVGC